MTISVSTARKNVGLSQREAAGRLRVTLYRLSRYERAKEAIPYEVLERMCDVYGCSLDDLQLPFVKGGAWDCETVIKGRSD